MQVVKDLIRDTLLIVQPDASFISGRSFDSALDTITQSTEVVYVYLDPVIKTLQQQDKLETYNISLGFIKQDARDSSPEEMDQIIEDMDVIATSFLNELESNNPTYMFQDITFTPTYRLKNVCTGLLLTFNIVTLTPC